MITFIKEHYTILSMVFELLFFSLAFVCYRVFQKEKFKSKKYAYFAALSLIPLFITYYVNTYEHLYEAGDCFLIKNEVVIGKPTEPWHKDYETKNVEYLILKIGNKNYYAHSTKPDLNDFPFTKERFSEKSDCSLIYPK